ncbi:MAG: PQQ-dependent sugar dehydrogenase [Chlorobia bacterium]|nr:PQQ-dependent sugar dehydrogenase [Fimbriimonadaceae bacterium]
MNILPILAFALSQAQPDSIPSSAGTLKVERLASLEFPWGITSLPDGRVLVTEKPGRLRIFNNGQLSAPVTGVPKVSYHEQGGMMDVERDPDFAQNQLVYLYFVEAAPRQTMVADTWDRRFGPKPKDLNHTLKGGAVARGRLVGNALQNVKVIWRQTPKTIGRGHFGGRIIFDRQGRLFITSGDRMRFDPAQNLSGNLGKVVRINRDGSIPSDNPWNGRDLWSIGHRNPLGGAFDPATGKLWIHEMGPLGGDEINAIASRGNYGWPIVSNGDNYNLSRIPDHDTNPRFAKPTITWNPVISPSGMIFYTGDMFSKWRGNALIGGLSSKSLIRVSIKNGIAKEEERIGLQRRIRDVHQAPDGSIWLLVDAKSGGLLRLAPE